MTTSPQMPAPPPLTRGPLRLHLADGQSLGAPDGAWWPQSRNLQAEAADLVDHFPESAGYIYRLLFSRPDWDESTLDTGRGVRRVTAGRGPVKCGSFPGDDTHRMVLTMSSGRRLSLVVIPSDTEPAEGERLLAAAGQVDAPPGEGTGGGAGGRS